MIYNSLKKWGMSEVGITMSKNDYPMREKIRDLIQRGLLGFKNRVLL